jgi:hypothetical protein
VVNGNYFVAGLIVLQLGAIVFYAREHKLPDALFFVGCAIANAAIIWRNA